MTTAERESEARPQIYGLTEAEATERHARGQNNITPNAASRSYKRIFVQNAFVPINLTLFGICIGLAVLGLIGDAAMTGSLVFANVVVGVFQEVRAKRKLDKISLLTRPTANIIREGRQREVDPEEIVVDDVLLIESGDQVLVDGVMLTSEGLTVDESLLTGESDLVPKRVGDEVQSGTFCMSGSGTFRAEKVGAESLAQKLTTQARKFKNAQTPLQREVGLALRVMAVVVVALSVQVVTAYRGSAEGMTVSESLRAAAVLVGLVPQGLSFMVTTTYALAVIRMAGTGALIQRINAVESISNVNLLCLDKTGTLTTNNLSVEEVRPLNSDALTVSALLGDYCASSKTGNRTTEAIAEAYSGGREREVIVEVPFSSARKWSAVQFGDGIYVMGAPEMLARALEDRSYEAHVQELAERGLRVLLFCHAPGGVLSEEDPKLPEGLVPLAVVSLRDELRAEAKDTITQFSDAGIGMKIISGDSPDTVAALAVQAGFASDLRAVSGLDLDALSDAELRRVAEHGTVFGRITPQQKERLIRVLRGRGRHIAMIGDGVNDVLALKQADLAIAMRSGSQVTRNVADIVLLDDSFATLPKAFVEGQRVRRGMLDIIRLFLVRTLSVTLVILAATLVGADFPTTPRQNGVLAFLTVGIPTLALAAWARPAHTPRRLLLSSAHFVIPAAISIAVTSFCVYQFALWVSDVETARTALTITAILCGVTLIAFAQPPTDAFVGGATLNGDWKIIWLCAAMVAMYVAILFIDPVRSFYEQEFLVFPAYLAIGAVVLGWAFLLRGFWRWNLPGQSRRLWRFLMADVR